MNKAKQTRQEKRQRRQTRVRAKITGTAQCLRLNVHRSLISTYAQLINDETGKVLVSAHSKKIDSKGDAGERKGKTAVAYLLGKELATKAKELKITKVVFDRAGFKYQGRVQAVAEGARDAGLEF
jgi:large subunit ribosomal protein L18